MEVEETRKVHSQYIRDEEGRLLRGKELISQRWARYFRSLLNSESDGLDPGITMMFPLQPAAYDLGVEPTDDDVAVELRGMRNSKAVGPDGLSVDFLNLGVHHDRIMLHRLITRMWREGRVPQQ